MSHYERLGNEDAVFLDVESPRNDMNVGVCLVFEAGPWVREDAGIDFDRLCTYIESRLEENHRYRQRLATTPIEGRWIWVDDEDFEISNHVRRVRLPEPGRTEQLQTLCAELIPPQLSRDRPLWEFWVIEGLESGELALLAKAHHCMVDGVAGMQLLLSLLTTEPTDAFDPPWPWTPLGTPGPLRLALSDGTRHVESLFGLVRRSASALLDPRPLVGASRELRQGFADLGRVEVHPVSDTPLNQPRGPGRVVEWRSFDIARIDEIRAARGGTLNDVVIATVTIALGILFEAWGIDRAEQRNLEIRIACPINRRPAGRRVATGNRISLLVARVPVGERDPLRILDEVRETMAEAKRSHMADAVDSIVALGDWMPRPMSRALTRMALQARSTSLVVTNVPGPPVPLYLLKSRLLRVHPIVPLLPGQALGVAVLSYAGRLQLGFNADRRAFRDLPLWASAMEQAFEALHADATRRDAGSER
jgi:WS/DGAT/MGAT family acyltransferase